MTYKPLLYSISPEWNGRSTCTWKGQVCHIAILKLFLMIVHIIKENKQNAKDFHKFSILNDI